MATKDQQRSVLYDQQKQKTLACNAVLAAGYE